MIFYMLKHVKIMISNELEGIKMKELHNILILEYVQNNYLNNRFPNKYN